MDSLIQLRIVTRAAARRFVARQGTGVHSADPEIAFYSQLAALYERAFGGSAGISTDSSNRRAGRFARFCGAIADRIAARAPIAVGAGANRLFKAIARLQTPSAVADRLRAARQVKTAPE